MVVESLLNCLCVVGGIEVSLSGSHYNNEEYDSHKNKNKTEINQKIEFIFIE